MKKQILLTALVSLLLVPAAFAQQEPTKPGFLPEAPHGGTLKEGKKMNLELVVRGNEIQLYPLNKMGQAVDAKNVQLTAVAQGTKKGKLGLQLAPVGDHYLGKLDAKALERIELKVEARAKGQKQDFTFQIEPQKM